MFAWVYAAAAAEPEMIPVEAYRAATERPAVAAGDVSFPLRDGGTFRLSERHGRAVLLTFWASWCAPCRRELPALSSWAERNPTVDVLAVNVDRVRQEADQFLSKVSFGLPVAYDPDARWLGTWGVSSMPTMFLFDRAGVLVWRHTGYSEEKGFVELDEAVRGAK